MKKANTNITFAQASDSTKAVVADRYVINALYVQNKALVEALGGEIVKGVDGFRAEFKSVKNAKAFIAQAVTTMTAKEYAKTRKSAPKAEVAKKATVPARTKGKAQTAEVFYNADGEAFTLVKGKLVPVNEKKSAKKSAKGNTKPTPAPNAKAKKAEPNANATPRKSKGNAELTPVQKKALEVVTTSVLNRAVAAHSVANGGNPMVTFANAGVSKKALAKYIKQAKAGAMKSSKWAYAVKHGVTEAMLDEALGC